MNPVHQAFWTEVAETDLRAIIEYISINNHHNALKILKKINDKASAPKTFPERGCIVPELQDQGISIYRELIVPPRRLIYRIAERKVLILSALDSRQNVEDILLKRMTFYDRSE